jgi:AcrR family transcriptional regulator
MVMEGKSRGNITRQANKKVRRERILDIAKHLIASEGLEAFTFSQLATEAGVSTPTIHNLFGKKGDIVSELVAELISSISAMMAKPIFGDPVESATYYIDSMVGLYDGNEDFYRAAYMSADKVGLFDDRESPEGFVQQSQKIARLCCTAALEQGFLLGNIDTKTLLRLLYDCHRIGRQDWVYGYIDLYEYRDRTLEGMLTVYASDASPECHNRLSKKIREIGI